MRRAAFRAGAVVLWVATMAWLVRFEACTETFTGASGGYQSMLSRDVLVSDTWLTIRSGNQPIGYLHHSVDTDQNDPVRFCEIANDIRLALTVGGTKQNVEIDSVLFLDVLYRLNSFSASLSAGSYTLGIEGIRVGEKTFRVVMKTSNATDRLTIQIPDDAILRSPVDVMAVRKLKPGQQTSVSAMDPFLMQKTTFVTKAVGYEEISIGGLATNALLLLTEYNGRSLKAWVDEEGAVLRQETPLGWVLERSNSEDAINGFAESRGGEDILLFLSNMIGGGIK